MGAVSDDQKSRAGWWGLLLDGAGYLQEAGAWSTDEHDAYLRNLKAAGEAKELIRLAEDLQQALKAAGLFVPWLEKSIKSLTYDEGRSGTLKAIRDLYLAGALVMTTNYDDLLEQVIKADPFIWSQQDEVHEVFMGIRRGIIHVHGHWRTEDSIILGAVDYRRIVDAKMQDLLKASMLFGSWVYIGVGEGLRDSNFSRLLEWARSWERTAPHGYWLRGGDSAQPGFTLDLPGFIEEIWYADHDELPDGLMALIPLPLPFRRIMRGDGQFFRDTDVMRGTPLPSFEEYVAEKVPKFDGWVAVKEGLDKDGFIGLVGKHSTGKTTMALSIAASYGLEECAVFYLKLGPAGTSSNQHAPDSFARLLKPDHIIVIDDTHQDPELASLLLEQWKTNANKSRLIVIGTEIYQGVTRTVNERFDKLLEGLDFVVIEPKPDDLLRTARFNYVASGYKNWQEPSIVVKQAWYDMFGSSILIFSMASLNRLGAFSRGDWTLTEEHAKEHVKKNWLIPLQAAEKDRAIENLITLSAFGTDGLELSIPEDALPHRSELPPISRFILAIERATAIRSRQFSLREPGWGTLIMQAHDGHMTAAQIRNETALRMPFVALSLSVALARKKLSADRNALWLHLETSNRLTEWTESLFDGHLQHALMVLAELKKCGKKHLAQRILNVGMENSQKMAERLLGAGLQIMAQFAREARACVSFEPVGNILRDNPKLVEMAWHSGPSILESALLDLSSSHIRSDIVESFQAEHGRFMKELILSNSVTEVNQFLNGTGWLDPVRIPTAHALGNEKDRLVLRAWLLGECNENTTADEIAVLLDLLAEGGHDVANIWEALRDRKDAFECPLDLLEVLMRSPLNKMASFLELMHEHHQRTDELWTALSRVPDRILEKAQHGSLDYLGMFIRAWRKAAPKDGSSDLGLSLFVEKIKSNPRWLAEKATKEPIQKIVSLMRAFPDDVELRRVILSSIEPGHWNDHPLGKTITSSAWFMHWCRESERDELADDLLRVVYERACARIYPHFGDFPIATHRGLSVVHFLELCHIVVEVFKKYGELAAIKFLNRTWRTRDLDKAYRTSDNIGRICGGIKLITRETTPLICDWFNSQGLQTRLAGLVAEFWRNEDSEKSRVVQLIGCMTLMGACIPERTFRQLNDVKLSGVLERINPHDDEAREIAPSQLQYWLGIRVLISTSVRIELSVPFIERTLSLWQKATEQAAEHTSKSGALDASMVRWLTECSARGRLVPSDEPLWVIAGFDRSHCKGKKK